MRRRAGLTLEPIDCAEILADVVAALAPLAARKGLALETDLLPGPVRARSDRRALSQIMMNLVNNAIKFTEEASVRLKLCQSRENGTTRTRISVRDTGIAIKPEDQERLFAAFEQIEGSATRRYEGTGLGLYISQKRATLLGGRISFESQAGVGSSFTVDIGEQS